MKKLLVACLMFVFPLVAFAGCDSAEVNFWSETYDKAYQLMTVSANTTEENIAIAKVVAPGEVLELEGNGDFQYSMEQNEAYAELAVYQSVLKLNLELTNTYLAQIDFTPSLVKENELKNVASLFSAFEKQVDSFRADIEAFLSAKEVFENKTKRPDFVSVSAAGLQHLREFKQSYSNLIGKAIAFNNSFEELFVGKYVAKFHTATTEAPLTMQHLKLANALARKEVAENFYEMAILPSSGKPIHTLMAVATVRLGELSLLSLADADLTTMLASESVVQNYATFQTVLTTFENEGAQVRRLTNELDIMKEWDEMKAMNDLGIPYLKSLGQQKAQIVIDYWDESVALLIRSAFRMPV